MNRFGKFLIPAKITSPASMVRLRSYVLASSLRRVTGKEAERFQSFRVRTSVVCEAGTNHWLEPAASQEKLQHVTPDST